MTGLALAAGAVVAVRRGSICPPNLAMGLADLWVSWPALTYFWSLDRQATLMRAITLAELLAMVWLIWDACHTPLRQSRLMRFYVWGAVAASASTFLRYLQGRQTCYRRYTSRGFDPNDFGLSLNIPRYIGMRAGAPRLTRFSQADFRTPVPLRLVKAKSFADAPQTAMPISRMSPCIAVCSLS